MMDTAKIFKNGRSQAVRLPRQYRFSGERVYIRKFGKATILFPEEDAWDVLIESGRQFSEDFLSERNQGQTERREDFFK